MFLILLWFYFDYMLVYETHRYGFARVMNRPDKYLTGSHTALKIVQMTQCLNLILIIIGVTKTSFVNEFF